MYVGCNAMQATAAVKCREPQRLLQVKRGNGSGSNDDDVKCVLREEAEQTCIAFCLLAGGHIRVLSRLMDFVVSRAFRLSLVVVKACKADD